MQKKIGFGLAVMLVLMLVGAACTTPTPTPTPVAKVITWEYAPSIIQPNPGSVTERYDGMPLSQTIEKATNGRLKLNVHYGLYKSTDVIDRVRDGTLDMGGQGPIYRAELALENFVALPILPRESLIKLTPLLEPIFEKEMRDTHGVLYLGTGYWGIIRTISKNPISTLEQLKGVRIRVQNPLSLEMMKGAGASPVFIDWGEVYLALQRGTIDAAISGNEGFLGAKLYETAKYVNDWPVGNASWMWIVNKDSWAKLPADLQGILMKLCRDQFATATFNEMRDSDSQLQAKLEAAGVKFIRPAQSELDKYMPLGKPVVDTWKKQAGPRAGEVIAIINKTLGTNY